MRGLAPWYNNVIIEFIPLSLAYNLHAGNPTLVCVFLIYTCASANYHAHIYCDSNQLDHQSHPSKLLSNYVITVMLYCHKLRSIAKVLTFIETLFRTHSNSSVHRPEHSLQFSDVVYVN